MIAIGGFVLGLQHIGWWIVEERHRVPVEPADWPSGPTGNRRHAARSFRRYRSGSAAARFSPTSRTFPCTDIRKTSFATHLGIAEQFTAYDAVYVALAEALDAPLLTRNRRLAAAAGHHVRAELV